MIGRAGARLSDFIIDLELMSFRRQQFITSVGVGGDELTLSRSHARQDDEQQRRRIECPAFALH